jgi:hypothetical protein
MDDIFGAGSPSEAAAEVVDEAGDALNSLLGNDPAGAENASADAASAAEMEDAFGGEGEASPAPADSSLDSIFGEPQEAAPAEGDGSLDDLFGDPEAEAAPAEDAAEPAAGSGAEASESLDDIFGTAVEEPSEAVSEEAEALDFDNLFGKGEAVAQSVAVQSVSVASVDPLSRTHQRTWIDNTGSFSVEGRLIEINEEAVRLLKTNGRTCTVPHRRLSPADAAYVQSVVAQLPEETVAMAVNR